MINSNTETALLSEPEHKQMITERALGEVVARELFEPGTTIDLSQPLPHYSERPTEQSKKGFDNFSPKLKPF